VKVINTAVKSLFNCIFHQLTGLYHALCSKAFPLFLRAVPLSLSFRCLVSAVDSRAACPDHSLQYHLGAIIKSFLLTIVLMSKHSKIKLAVL